MTASASVPTDLFGGALHVHLPPDYLDASTVREVPSTQEVFVPATTSTDTSIIIDILEPPLPIAPSTGAPSDGNPDLAALQIHWDDIASPHASHVFSITPVAALGARAWCVLGTVEGGGGGGGGGYTAILATVIRLERVKTDLVVSVNVPISATEAARERSVCAPGSAERGNGGEMGEALRAGCDIRDLLLGTLEVRDWGLFVN